MNERTVKRGIAIAAVWMVVLAVNVAAAYAVTTDSLDQRQSGLIVFEDDRTAVETPSSAGDSADPASNDRRDASNDWSATDTATADEQPAAVERASDERRSPGNDNPSETNPSTENDAASGNDPQTASSETKPVGDARSSEHRQQNADDRRSDSTPVESAASALGLGSSGDHPGTVDSRNANPASAGHNGNPREANDGREKPGKPNVGPPGRQQTTCTSGELLAKYEVRGNSLVFEKGTDTVTIPDSVHEEGELKSFGFESSAFVSTAVVKFGPETRTVEIHGRHGTVDLAQEKHAISNVVFCQNPFYQVDFVTGPPIENLGEDRYGDRKVQFASGVVGKDSPQNRNDGDRPACLAHTEAIEITADGTAATVTFDVTERCELSLVSYETRSLRFDPDTAEHQQLVDSVSRTFDPGRYEITVSLPDAGNQERGA